MTCDKRCISYEPYEFFRYLIYHKLAKIHTAPFVGDDEGLESFQKSITNLPVLQLSMFRTKTRVRHEDAESGNVIMGTRGGINQSGVKLLRTLLMVLTVTSFISPLPCSSARHQTVSETISFIREENGDR